MAVISVFVLFISSALAFADGKTALWERHYGGGKSDGAFAIKSLPGGGSIISGYTRSNKKGDANVWVIRLDSAGKKLWEKNFGGVGQEISTAVTPVKGGGFVVMAYTQKLKSGTKDAWLIRLDKKGNKLWDKYYGGATDDMPYAVLAMPDGGVAVAGFTLSKNKKDSDGWVFRVDRRGKVLWEKKMGGSGRDWFRSLALLPNGDIIVVGSQQNKIIKAALTASLTPKRIVPAAWAVRLKQNGKKVWAHTYFSSANAAHSVVVQKNGDIAMAGWTRSKKLYGKDTWIISLNGKGQEQWKKIIGGAGEDKTDSMTVLSDGTLALAGVSRKSLAIVTTNTAWVLALDNKGKVLWERPYGIGRADQVHAITTLTDGRIAVAGGTWRPGKGTDAWVFTLSQKGEAPLVKAH